MITPARWTKDDLMKFIKSVDKKTWGKIGTALVAFLLVWFLVIGPAWFDRPRMHREIESMNAQMKQFNGLNQKRLIWEQNEAQFGKIIQEAMGRRYSEAEMALLLGQISRLATGAKVDVIASKPQPETLKFPPPFQNQYEADVYDFTMKGGYHAVAQLVAGIESYPKLLRIRKIHITPVKESPERHIAQLDIVAISAAGSGVANAPKQ